ncbi:hypothetical protein N7454_008092 [Penicillium verhagenii]|nr:hypothetical protein N7454_008092 [Penicillium verhagenii]
MRECVFPEKRAWERSGKRARSNDETDDQISPRADHYLSDRTPETTNGRYSQNNQSPTQYPGSSPFQSGWALNGHSASLQHDHSPPINISASPGANAINSSNRPSSHNHHDHRHRSNPNLASSMMRTVVASGNDALNILFEAATAQSQEDNAHHEPSPSGRANSSNGQKNTQERSTPRHYETPIPFEPVPRNSRPVDLAEVSRDTLQVWEACRFVRMGWFTAREAVTFIDLFYKNMSCLSPILTDFYSNHQNHYLLITREPVLCCTILMISSRYHILPGAGEKSTKSKIRSLGTVEALLLMAEWHPRSLHFPPETDGWDDDLISMGPTPSESTDPNSGSASRWLEDMIEPSRRSDQMSWMLLGSGLSLAHELGIFETEDDDSTDEDPQWREQMALRRQRVQRLLYVYINQLAWRIGCMSPIPQSLNHAVLGGRKPRGLSQPGSTWLIFMDSWIELTKLAQSVTDMFFPSAKFARQQLHSGRYIGLLDHFRPLLNQWKDKYLQPDVLDKSFYNDLFIEYHFVRVYTHSVGMQAVVERALADADSNFDDVRPMTIEQTDYEYIQEVIDGCCQILRKVTHLADAGALRFSPVRIVLRVTSASIFLMKALSLGTREAVLRDSLEVLEKSISALKSNALDDVHLSTRYATLLEMHVSRLRHNLLASSKAVKNARGAARPSSMGPPAWPDASDRANQVNTPVPQDLSSDLGFMPSLNDMTDDWLSLPFDPSMAPFGMTNGSQFPMCEGGALDFIWNLPS